MKENKKRRNKNFWKVVVWTVAAAAIILAVFEQMGSAMFSPSAGSLGGDLFLYFAGPFIGVIIAGLTGYYFFINRKIN